MNRATTIPLSVLLLFIFAGCVQNLQKTKQPSTATAIQQVEQDDVGAPKDTQASDRTIADVQPELDEALEYCKVSQECWQKGELEKAIEALDQAYALILQIDDGDDPKLAQEKEDLRFMISKRILEIYASRHVVVNGYHNAIPLEMNSHVQAEVDKLTSKNREQNFFTYSYRRSGRYRPYIVKALKEAGLPEELSWLPLIESGFKTNALSSARALGLWQFISSTGYKFGLKRTMYIDERLDPYKSTQAAIAYLKELHQIFGDWTTVLAAYNCGEGRVLRVIKRQNVNYLDNFWDLYTKLPRETARYVPRFLATLHILNHPKKFGLDQIQPDPPLAFETVSVSKKVHLKEIAKVTGIEEKTLKELNPELRYKIVPGDGYALRVPPQTAATVTAKMGDIPEYKKSAPTQRSTKSYVYYRVKSGDTLSTIARRHRTSVKRIKQANNLRKGRYLSIGQKLKIPRKGATVQRTTQTKKRVYAKTGTHVVKSGDSLWIIARRYGTTTQRVKAANGLKSNRLRIGQKLKIPGRSKSKPAAATRTISSAGNNNYKTYLVKSGDSPFRIAQSHKMPLDQFLRINRLTPRSRIYPGQKVQVE